jgi:lantibiotic biosynthesis protein
MTNECYKPFNRFVLRTPLFPFNSDLDNSKIKVYFQNSIFKEAIYIASPTLYKELLKYLNGEATDDKVLLSLVRYLNRMATRCTPFGLFAGCTVGHITDKTNIVLEGSFIRKTRLDMYYLCKLYDTLIDIPEIREEILFYPNTSLFQLGKNYRYIERKHVKSGFKHQIIEIKSSNHVDRVLKIARNGARISIMTSSLISNEISIDEASDFINEMIDSQLLIGELNHSVMGSDYLDQIINRIKTIKNIPTLVLQNLINISLLLKEGDKRYGTDYYARIIDNIKGLNASYEDDFLFQVDISPQASSIELSNSIIDDVKLGVEFLNKITLKYENSMLKQFKQDFYSRYEDREIPLLLALDIESGIGYPANQNKDISPLVDDLDLQKGNEQKTISLSEIHSLLLNKAMESLLNGRQEVVFTDEDVRKLDADWSDLPPTISVIFDVLGVAKDNSLIKIKSCGGNSAGNLLSRFAHIDTTIEDLLTEITVKEDELCHDKIVAEIVHLPESRIGNILFRPHIRKYELPYLGTSDSPSENRIHISDLTISVRNNRLVIRSKRLQKEVVPRLTTAHNYQGNSSMPVYRFLCDMQNHMKRANLCFSWGGIDLPFYPRIRYKNLIISEAEWRLRSEDIKHLFAVSDDLELMEKIKLFRETLKIPRFVWFSDMDNELFVDWTNPIYVRSLFSIIRNRPKVVFKEFFFNSENATVNDLDGKAYMSEFIVAFYKSER